MSPATWTRIVPKRTTREPPALVATAPPTVAESRLAKSTGASNPAAWACRRQSAIVTPAPSVTCERAGVDGAARVRRLVDSTTIGSPRGTLPPTSPVLPPCGTTGDAGRGARPRARRRPRPVDPGRTTSSASPTKRPVQSRANDAVTSGSSSTWSGPTTSASVAPRARSRRRRPQQQRLQGPTDRALVVEQQRVGQPVAGRLPRRRGPAAHPLADRVAVQGDQRGRC